MYNIYIQYILYIYKYQVWDHDYLKSDDFIGETVIDLEDRWFHPKWVALGGKTETKPLEVRQLFTRKSKNTQGQITLWYCIYIYMN